MFAFHVRCPEVGFSEYRSIHLRDSEDPPDGDYGFMELYCDEADCDCRRVLFVVVAPQFPGETLATFSYGWESEEFYEEKCAIPALAIRMAGLSVEPLEKQSQYAPALFRECEELLLSDPAYVERLKRHYALFKKAVLARHWSKKAKRKKRRRK